MAIDPKHIINLKGKDFILFAGLLNCGHEQGLIGLETEVIESLSDPKEQSWVVRAVGRFEGDAQWSAYGDASPASSQMRGAYLRHAETRAVARMLRMATNISMTAFEELGPDGATAAGMGEVDHSSVSARDKRGANERVRHAESRGDRAANPAAPASADASAVAPVEGYIYQSPEDRLEQAKDESTILTYCQARGCREILTAREAEGCRKRPEWFDGKEFCTKHAREYRQQQAGLSQANLPEGQIAA